MRKTLEERFWDKVEKTDGCWLWTGCCDGGGYGQIWDLERMRKAHRVSWKIYNGLIENGLFVLHKCDVQRCVNPDHLFLGTQQDNVTDMIGKGRQNYTGNGLAGENHPLSKLTHEKACSIREMYSTGYYYQRDLGKLFGVAQSQIANIIHNRTWVSV